MKKWKIILLSLIMGLFVLLPLSGCEEFEEVKYENPCKVIFEVDGIRVHTAIIEKGEKVAKPTIQGIDSATWYCQGEEWSFVGYLVTDDMTLYAKDYELTEYHVVFSFNYEGGRKFYDRYNMLDKNVEFPNPQREFYRFEGWYDNTECKGNKIDKIENNTLKDQYFYAKWEYEAFTFDEVSDGYWVSGFNGNKQNISEATIPDFYQNRAVVGITPFAFYQSKLKNIVISNNVRTIGRMAFAENHDLTRCDLGVGVTRIEGNAFSDCSSLTSFFIPRNVSGIEGNVFSGCASLEKIDVDQSNTAFCSEQGVLYDKKKLKIITVPQNFLGKLTIPDSVTRLESNVFSGCKNLKTVVIGKGVTYMGENVFADCENLESIEVDAENTTLSSSYGILYDKMQGKLLFIPQNLSGDVVLPEGIKEIGDNTFKDKRNIISIVIPDSVTNISSSAFTNCINLEEVEFGKGMTMLPSNLFKTCSNLKLVTVSNTLEYLGTSFNGCRLLTTIIFKGTKEEWNAVNKVALWNQNTALTTVICADGTIYL